MLEEDDDCTGTLCQTVLDHTYNYYTVEPQLSVSPLFEPSVIQMLFRILKSQKTIWFSTKSSNKWNACVILDLLVLLYHSTVGRKSY